MQRKETTEHSVQPLHRSEPELHWQICDSVGILHNEIYLLYLTNMLLQTHTSYKRLESNEPID